MSKVITGKVRFSYAYLFKPQAGIGGGDEKYSVSAIIPKDDKKTFRYGFNAKYSGNRKKGCTYGRPDRVISQKLYIDHT
jgi:hypothetical protein